MSSDSKHLLNEKQGQDGSLELLSAAEESSPNEEMDNFQNDHNNEQYAAMCIELLGEVLEKYNLVYVPNSEVKEAKKLGAITPIQLLTKNKPPNQKKMICSVLRRLQNQTFIPEQRTQKKNTNYPEQPSHQNFNPLQCHPLYRTTKAIGSPGQIRMTHTFEQSERKLCNEDDLNANNVNDIKETKSYIARIIDEGKDDCKDTWKMDRILQRTEAVRGNNTGKLTRGVVNISRYPGNSRMPDFLHYSDLTSLDSDPQNTESEEIEDHNRAYLETCNLFFNLDEEATGEEEEECNSISRNSNAPMRNTGGEQEHIISNEDEMLENSEEIKFNSFFDGGFQQFSENHSSIPEGEIPLHVEVTVPTVDPRLPDRIPSSSALYNLSIIDDRTFENMSRLLESEDLEVTIEDYFSD